MAAAVATFSITDNRYTWSAGSKYIALGTLAISASPATYTTGGIACNLFNAELKASRFPWYAEIIGQTGYVYKYIPGVDASAGLLKIFVQDGVSGNPLAEMANTTVIPAAVSGDSIQAFLIFQGME